MSDNKKNNLVLENFLPYRLSYLTNIISRKLSRLYSGKFNISPHEWRILANLNRYPHISAAETGERTAMDKVTISRAIKSLCDMGLVHKIFSKEDRRRSVLSLTREGKDIYRQIEPLVTGYENSLLSSLNHQELSQLDHLLNKLTDHVTKG
ncbi:MAG: MarR family transcriptional regulator [Alphaproteobacteria bacterium]|nr:MAG: MarR family transcriptional regulator [Alphaproteobacteria bacterium]